MPLHYYPPYTAVSDRIVTMTFAQASRWIESQGRRILELEAALRTIVDDPLTCQASTRIARQALAPPDIKAKSAPTCSRPHCESVARPLHTCPYKRDINGDNESLCDCCHEHTQACCDDI